MSSSSESFDSQKQKSTNLCSEKLEQGKAFEIEGGGREGGRLSGRYENSCVVFFWYRTIKDREKERENRACYLVITKYEFSSLSMFQMYVIVWHLYS
jgi:hypothetical protein